VPLKRVRGSAGWTSVGVQAVPLISLGVTSVNTDHAAKPRAAVVGRAVQRGHHRPD
jgi:hypothetical protein